MWVWVWVWWVGGTMGGTVGGTVGDCCWPKVGVRDVLQRPPPPAPSVGTSQHHDHGDRVVRWWYGGRYGGWYGVVRCSSRGEK